MSDSGFTEVQWAPPNNSNGNGNSRSSNKEGGAISKHALLSLQSAATAAKEFNETFSVCDGQREASVPLFMGDELVLGREPIRQGGYYAEYELRSVRVLMDLVEDGDFSPIVEATRQNVLEQSAKGTLSVKYLQSGLVESDHGPGAAADMITDIRILMNMAPHRNVAEIYGINQGGIDTLLARGRRGFFMITDRITETLSDRMSAWREKRRYDTNSTTTRFNQRMQVALEVASALVHLHDNEIVYHLRPDKVGYDKRHGRIKLYNFSQARQDGTKEHSPSLTKSDDICKLAYTAPEVLCMAPATASADVYSFGILLWEMMSLRFPYDRFDRATHFEQAVQNHKRPPVNRNWPQHLRQLLEACWHPHMRLAMKKVHQTLESTLLLSAQLSAHQVSPVAGSSPVRTTRNMNRSECSVASASASQSFNSNSNGRTAPPSPGGRGRSRSRARHSLSIGILRNEQQQLRQRGRSVNSNNSSSIRSPRGKRSGRSLSISRGRRDRSRSRSQSRSRHGKQQQSLQPIPIILGGGSNNKDKADLKHLVVEFDKSQTTNTTVPDNSSIGSSTGPELSSPPARKVAQKSTPVPQSEQATPTSRRGMMSRMGSLREAFRGSDTSGKEGKNEPSKTKKTKASQTTGTSKPNLLQKTGGSVRNVFAGQDEPEQAKASQTTGTSKRNLLQKTGGSVRNVFNKARSQRGLSPGKRAASGRGGLTDAAIAGEQQSPLSPRKIGLRRQAQALRDITPSTPRSLQKSDANSKRNLISPGTNGDNAPETKTPLTREGSPRKQGSLRNINRSGESPTQEELIARCSVHQKIAGSQKHVLTSSNSDLIGSVGNISFDPSEIVEQSPKPKQRDEAKSRNKEHRPRKTVLDTPKKGGKASPTQKRPSLSGGPVTGSLHGNGSICGSDHDEGKVVAAAAAARENDKQQILAAVPQSAVAKSYSEVDDLRVPDKPDHSVSQTVNVSVGTSVFDKLLDLKTKEGGHDSLNFEWNIDLEDDDDLDVDNDDPPVVKEKTSKSASLGALKAIPVTLGKPFVTDQASTVSCLTNDSSECPAAPSRQVAV